jgi:hypothetical protein
LVRRVAPSKISDTSPHSKLAISSTYLDSTRRHGPGPWLIFLAVKSGGGVFFLRAQVHLFLQNEFALDEQAGGTAAWVINVHAGLGVHDSGDDEADFGWRIKLAGALTAAFSEFSNEILITAAADVGFNVIETEPLGADGLNEVAQAGVVNITLAVSGGVEVDAVDDALEQRVGVGDGAEASGKLLADLVRKRADD